MTNIEEYIAAKLAADDVRRYLGLDPGCWLNLRIITDDPLTVGVLAHLAEGYYLRFEAYMTASSPLVFPRGQVVLGKRGGDEESHPTVEKAIKAFFGKLVAEPIGLSEWTDQLILVDMAVKSPSGPTEWPTVVFTAIPLWVSCGIRVVQATVCDGELVDATLFRRGGEKLRYEFPERLEEFRGTIVRMLESKHPGK